MIIYADFEYDNDSNVPSKRTYMDVIQLGFVVCDDNNREIKRLEYNVKSQHWPIKERITLLTGITSEQNKNAPDLENVLNEISDYIVKASKFIIFGNADIVSLRNNRKYLSKDGKKLLNLMVNKMTFFEYRRRGFSFSLSNLCDALGISREGEHSALADAVHFKDVVKAIGNDATELKSLDPYIDYRLAYNNIKSALKLVSREQFDSIVGEIAEEGAALGYADWNNKYLGK